MVVILARKLLEICFGLYLGWDAEADFNVFFFRPREHVFLRAHKLREVTSQKIEKFTALVNCKNNGGLPLSFVFAKGKLLGNFHTVCKNNWQNNFFFSLNFLYVGIPHDRMEREILKTNLEIKLIL